VSVSLASFLVCHPEFVKAGDAMIAAVLAHIEVQVSDSFGDQRDMAVMLALADALALSPWGRVARLVSPTATSTTYGARFAAMALANAVSASRLGTGLLTTRLGTIDGDE
jgi:hypothetical protein